MLQVQYIAQNKAETIAGLEKKRVSGAAEAVERLLQTDTARREAQKMRDDAQAEANQAAKQIGQLMKAGDKQAAEAAKEQSAGLKDQVKALNEKVLSLEADLQEQLYKLPNLPHASVPAGGGAADNIIVFEKGEKPNLPANASPHWDLISQYKLIDFDLGNKVTGAGFPFYTGKGAKLQRALINFFLDEADRQGYTEVQPPILINEASGFGTGQLPDKEGQMYKIENHDYYLIPTAEVPITNMLRDQILEAKQLPLRFVGYTPCFRREAGSWGADVRGLNRLHQFDKVEIVEIQAPEHSYEALERMCGYVEGLLEKLELPFRKLLLCGGDISFNAALCFDMEVYSAAQERWLEVSSVSNFEQYQANRLNLRYKDGQNKKQLLHTLNGSALALPRIMAALLENNQTETGIDIPKVLQRYCGFEKIEK